MLSYNPDWTKTPKSGKYRAIKCPDHPRAWPNGYIHLHVVVAEQKLGRLLADGEVVHHKDENSFNNDPTNLEIMSAGSHAKHHHPEHPPIEVACSHCGVKFFKKKRQLASVKGYLNDFCSYSCNAKYQGSWRGAVEARKLYSCQRRQKRATIASNDETLGVQIPPLMPSSRIGPVS